MLIRKQDAPVVGEKLTVRVTFPAELSRQVRDYGEAAGYSQDYPSLLADAIQYVIANDPDFRDGGTLAARRSAPRGRRKKGARIAPEPPPAPDSTAQTPAETAAPETPPAAADSLPRRGLFGGLRS